MEFAFILRFYPHLLIVICLKFVLFVLVLYLVLVLRWRMMIFVELFKCLLRLLDMMELRVFILLFRIHGEMICLVDRDSFFEMLFMVILVFIERLFVCNDLCIVWFVLLNLWFFSLILFFAFLVILKGRNSLFLFSFFRLLPFHKIITVLLIIFIVYQ